MPLNPFAEAGKAQLYKTNLQGVDPNLRYRTQEAEQVRKEAANKLAAEKKKKALEIDYDPEEAWDIDSARLSKRADDILQQQAIANANGTNTEEAANKARRELQKVNSDAQLTMQQKAAFEKANTALNAALPGVYKDEAREMLAIYSNPEKYPEYKKILDKDFGGNIYQFRAYNQGMLDLTKASKPINANEYANRFTGALKSSDVENGNITIESLKANKPKIKEQVIAEYDSAPKYSDTKILYRQWVRNREAQGLTSTKDEFVDYMTDLVYNRQKTKYGKSEDENTGNGYGSRKAGTYYTPTGKTLVSSGQTGAGSSSKILLNTVSTETGNKPLRAISSDLMQVTGTNNSLSKQIGSQNVNFTPEKTGYPYIAIRPIPYLDEHGNKAIAKVGSLLPAEAEKRLVENGQLNKFTKRSTEPYTFGTVKIVKSGKETKTPLVPQNVDGKTEYTINGEVFKIDETNDTATSSSGNVYELAKENGKYQIINFDNTGAGTQFSTYVPTNKIKGELKGRFGQGFIDEVNKGKPKAKVKKYVDKNGNDYDVSGATEEEIKEAIKYNIIKEK